MTKLQVSEYSFHEIEENFPHARVLNILFLKYKKSSVMSEFWIVFFWKIKKAALSQGSENAPPEI